MANGIRTGNPRGFNKGRSSKFREASTVRQIPGEGRRTYQPKHCENNNKDENNSLKTLNDKNQRFDIVFQNYKTQELNLVSCDWCWIEIL